MHFTLQTIMQWNPLTGTLFGTVIKCLVYQGTYMKRGQQKNKLTHSYVIQHTCKPDIEEEIAYESC